VLRYPFHHLSSAALTVWKKIGSGILNGASMTWYEESVKWSTKDFVALVFASRQFFHE
jgi:hypothetical protein